jgi:hypothetical protein
MRGDFDQVGSSAGMVASQVRGLGMYNGGSFRGGIGSDWPGMRGDLNQVGSSAGMVASQVRPVRGCPVHMC